MPSFSFVCQCGHTYDEFRWPSEGMPKECPNCSEPFGEKFNQDWMKNRPLGFAKGESSITTFGQQAELNAKRMGKEQLQMMVAEDRQKRSGIHGKLPEGAKYVPPEPEHNSNEIPWWRDGSIAGTKKLEKPLDTSKITDLGEYIVTGKEN